MQAALTMLDTAFKVLSARVLAAFALVASAALFVWAVSEPSVLRITAACLFAIIVFLPALLADAKRQ